MCAVYMYKSKDQLSAEETIFFGKVSTQLEFNYINIDVLRIHYEKAKRKKKENKNSHMFTIIHPAPYTHSLPRCGQKQKHNVYLIDFLIVF